MDWRSPKTGSPRFWIRREVTSCLVKCCWRAAKRRTRTNRTAARLRPPGRRMLFGRGPRLGSSMATIQRIGKPVSNQLCCGLSPMCEPIVHRVGGCIPREFCRLRLEKRRKEMPRCGKHCLLRKPECPITSAGWRSQELHLRLDLNDFDTPLAKPFREFLRSTVVRNQTPNFFERPDSRNAAATQFAEVRHDVHFARRTDH